jgi:aspartyl-tRNA(Asn)/glutamyl-tRNA(Gln) amidotransferase subunit A
LKLLPPIAWTLERLAAGDTSSLDLVDVCLEAIADPAGEGSRTFISLTPGAKAKAARYDLDRRAGTLAGLPLSIKDLFDVAGEVTTAGSRSLAEGPPSICDSAIVQRLHQAGAIVVGRTNMTEFAYSGLGLNPHHGTPRNPHNRSRGLIPGGSSSGAAVSVSDGMAHAAIGSDTGGSVRIPAALCGLTGFKPTARRVPLDGVLPLSPSLDSIGPIAPTVACCARIDAVLAGEEPHELLPRDPSQLRLAVLQGYVIDGLEDQVASAFSSALSALSSRGCPLTDVRFSGLDSIAECNRNGGIAAAEAFAWHRHLLERDSSQYDPRVLSRLLRGKNMTAADYLDMLRLRRQVIREAANAFRDFDAILLPTVPRTAPPIAELEASDTAYYETNAAMLRNPSIFNFIDGCALSIPCHMPGQAPAGLMIAGLSMQDHTLLGVGAVIEATLSLAGCAIHGFRSEAATPMLV